MSGSERGGLLANSVMLHARRCPGGPALRPGVKIAIRSNLRAPRMGDILRDVLSGVAERHIPLRVAPMMLLYRNPRQEDWDRSAIILSFTRHLPTWSAMPSVTSMWRDSAQLEPGRFGWLRKAAALLVVTAALCWPAVYNGFPLVFADTAAYVQAANWSVLRDRPIAYGIFLRWTAMRTGSLWWSIASQSLLCAVMLWLTISLYQPSRLALQLVVIGLVLALATTLSWFASQLMPDFLMPLAILSAFLLLIRWRDAAPAARAFAFALLVFACAAHYSILLVTGALTALVLGWGVFGRELVWVWAGVRGVLVLAAACAVILVINFRQSGEIVLTRGGHLFMLGRLAESGILQRLLADRCGRTDYVLCPYRKEIPDSVELFMFTPQSPLYKVGGKQMPRAPAMRMVRDAIRYYPAEVVGSSLAHTARQFFLFYTGDGLHPELLSDPRWWLAPRALRYYFPAEYPSFAASRQQSGTLPIAVFRPVNAVVEWSALVGSALLLLLALRARVRGDPERAPPAADLHAFIWLGTALNAGACATLTTVTDRFQSRVVWLFVFACLVTFGQLSRFAQRSPSESVGSH